MIWPSSSSAPRPLGGRRTRPASAASPCSCSRRGRRSAPCAGARLGAPRAARRTARSTVARRGAPARRRTRRSGRGDGGRCGGGRGREDREPESERRGAPRAHAGTPKCSRTIGTTSRSVHCGLASALSGPVPHHSSVPRSRWRATSRASRRRRGGRRPSRGTHSPGSADSSTSPAVAAAQRRPHPPERVRVGGRDEHAVLDGRGRGAPRSPSTLQRAAAAGRSARRPGVKRSSPRAPRIAASPSGWSVSA